MAQLEIFDGTNWIQLGGQTNIALTGAVIGNGSSNINTSLNMTQNMSGLSLGVNWSNSGSFAEYSIYHYLQDSTPPPQFVETIQAGTYAANTYRWWNLIFQPGLSSSPSGNFQIDFVHNVSGRKTPFKITSIGSGFTTYISSTLNMNNNIITGLNNPVNPLDAVNRNYVDTKTLGSFNRSMDFQTLYYLADPIMGWDAATKNYVDFMVNSANTKLQYFGYWDQSYPIYITRSMYISNSYTPSIREYGTYGYLSRYGTSIASDAPVYDIKCDNRIRASEFNAWSSKNIKNIIEIGEKAGEEASRIIQDIPIVKYNYKDPLINGKGEFFGVISEEILNYLPDYVTTKEFKFVPNIMMFGKLNSIDYQYFTILLQGDKILDKSFIGKTIQIIKDNLSASGVLESIDNKIITVKLESKVSIIEKDLDVFVYGTYEDCPTVSLKHLSELSLCALVNCIKRITFLEEKLMR